MMMMTCECHGAPICQLIPGKPPDLDLHEVLLLVDGVSERHDVLFPFYFLFFIFDNKNLKRYYFLNWGRQLTPDELDMLNEDENLVS